MSWSHRSCLERHRVFLVSQGVDCAEGEAMGFAYVTRSFADAFGKAMRALGEDASVVVNAAGSTLGGGWAGPRAQQPGIPYPVEG